MVCPERQRRLANSSAGSLREVVVVVALIRDGSFRPVVELVKWLSLNQNLGVRVNNKSVLIVLFEKLPVCVCMSFYFSLTIWSIQKNLKKKKNIK